MRIRKEILLFYVLIIASVGVIIAAEQPMEPSAQPTPIPTKENPVKRCKMNNRPAAPVNYISEGFLRLKA